MALVFDIETVGESWDEIDRSTQEGLIKSYEKRARNEEEKKQAEEEAVSSLGLSPFTGRVVAIGMIDSDTDKGAVLFQAPSEAIEETEEDGIRYLALSEKEILSMFWNKAKTSTEFVTYNGRGFDVPYLIIRSIATGVKPTVDLMSNRYVNNQYGVKHYDLQDLLTFYGATGRSSLHLACRAFGIKSPKDEGVSGSDVGEMFKKKQYLEIAKYNAGDVAATKELYLLYRSYLRY